MAKKPAEAQRQAARDDRLKAALKANLARRKDQARKRGDKAQANKAGAQAE